jgi:hypothetical protein
MLNTQFLLFVCTKVEVKLSRDLLAVKATGFT